MLVSRTDATKLETVNSHRRWFIDASSFIEGRHEPKVNIHFPVAEEGLTTDILTAILWSGMDEWSLPVEALNTLLLWSLSPACCLNSSCCLLEEHFDVCFACAFV